jgi:hypothetical protein
LGSNDIFLTENWVPKIHFDLVFHSSAWQLSIWSNDLVIPEFGVFLWELISRQPQAEHGEVSHLVLFLESIVHFLFTQLILQVLAISFKKEL